MLGVVTFCVLQYVVIARVGEPYPAIMMPGFDGTGGAEADSVSSLSVETVFVEANGNSKVLTLRRLFSEIPDSHHHVMALQFFSPGPQSAADNDAVIRGMRRGLKYRLFPGLHLGRECRDCEANLSSLRSWLQSRASEAFPGQRFTRVEFRWFREVFSLKSEKVPLRCDRVPIGTFEVELAG